MRVTSVRARSAITSISAPPSSAQSEGVLQRTPQGFHIDQARVAYIRHLRRERRPSSQDAAVAELAVARAEWLVGADRDLQ